MAVGAVVWACSSSSAQHDSSTNNATEPGGPNGSSPAVNAGISGGSDAGTVAVGSDPDAGPGEPGGPPPVPYTDYDVNHILMTGQSNSFLPPISVSR